MRRFLIFGLLGPVLGYVVVRYGFLIDSVDVLDPSELTLLPLAYFMGLIPALAAAWVDQMLSDRGFRRRPLWTAAAAFALSFLPILVALVYLGFNSPWLLLWGIVGAVPALICSALCGPSRAMQAD